MSTDEQDMMEERMTNAVNRVVVNHLRWLIVCSFGVGIWMARMEYIYAKLVNQAEWERKEILATVTALANRTTALENRKSGGTP